MLNSAETTRASVITEFLRCIYKSFARKIFSRAGKSMQGALKLFLQHIINQHLTEILWAFNVDFKGLKSILPFKGNYF